MPEIFINYRTIDAKDAANTIYQNLVHRFGEDRVYLDHESIHGGDSYPPSLINAVRGSSVLLALIGPDWLTVPGKSGGRAVDDENDWTRWEIIEAFECGVRVMPVLLGRRTKQLAEADLPPELSRLAYQQSRMYDDRDSVNSLTLLAQELVRVIPGLADGTRQEADRPDSGGVYNTVTGTTGPVVQARDVGSIQLGGTGSFGTHITNPTGPVNTGSGDQYNDLRPRRAPQDGDT